MRSLAKIFQWRADDLYAISKLYCRVMDNITANVVNVINPIFGYQMNLAS